MGSATLKRYAIRNKRNARSYEDEYEDWSYCPPPHATTVYEPEPVGVPTGLLDAHGNEIMAIEERDPIGFVWPKG